MEDKLLKIIANIADDEIVYEDKDVDLFDTGLIDSMSFIELLVEIDNQFGVAISPSEIDRSQMNTPNKLLGIVQARINK